MLESMYSYGTHAVMNGGPNSGKSTGAELCAREKIKRQEALFFLDYHGTTFERLIEYCAYIEPVQPVYILNFSRPDLTGILPIKLFTPPNGGFLSAHVTRMVDVLLKPWGVQNANLMPTYESVAPILFAYSAVTGEPLHHAAYLLDIENYSLREEAIKLIPDQGLKRELARLQHVSTLRNGYREWRSDVMSTGNRLNRIAGSELLRLFFGLPALPASFSIEKAWEEGAVVLMNLTPSRKYLSPQDARTIAALMFDEILQCSLDRAGNEKPCWVYADEAQNYVTEDMASMLTGGRKSGLRVTLIHHHMDQFHDQPKLQAAIRTAARCRFIFQGMPANERKEAVEECFLPQLNERWKKEDRYIVWTDYEEEDVETENWSFNDSAGQSTTEEGITDTWHGGSTFGSSKTTRLVPYQYLEECGQEDFSVEDKRLQLSARFANLEPTQCYVNLPDRTRFYEFPWCETYLANGGDFVRFMRTSLSNNIPLHAAQKQIKEREETFLARTGFRDAPIEKPKGKQLPKPKRPARLFPQS